MTYVELHCHSCFSLREGASTPLELVLRARELGYDALALTDHDNLAGAMEFAQTAKGWGVRPIIGAEVTLVNGAHLTLLAETPRGYANLSRLLSRANLGSPRGEPRVRFDWLPEHADGLIALSGCRRGEVAALVEQNEARSAREVAERYRTVFGRESFFIELQDNLVYEDQSRNEGLVALARDLELGLVASNNVHYHARSRHRLHDVLVAVRHRSNLEEARPHLRANSEFYLKHPQEMKRLFDGLPEAIENTVRIAARCTGLPYRIEGEQYPGLQAGASGEAQHSGLKDGAAHIVVARAQPEASSSSPPDEPYAQSRGAGGAAHAGGQGGCPPKPHLSHETQQRDSDAQRPGYGMEQDPGLKDGVSGGAQHPGLKDGAWAEHEASPAREVATSSSVATALPPVAPPARITLARRGFDLTRDLSYVFPDYEAADGRSADQFLRDLCYQKARDYYGAPLPEAVEIRLLQELDLVRQGKRAGFFLRLGELLEYAHSNNLPARGRGSSVGSLVCFLLGLSGIDPMKYDLVVERFLNEERLDEDVPDIDLDFGREARDRMFRHIFETYGTEHAAQVAALIEYRYASAIRDVGKALGRPQGEIDKVAKRMRSRFAGNLKDELEAMPEFATRQRFPIWRDFIDLVEQLRGLPRHLSQHSGGVIISTTRIDEQVPVEAAAMDGRFICQWDKDSVADAGFIKLDLLGYPSLDQLERGLRYVRERHGRMIKPERIDLSDPKVYEMIQHGDVLGIVQIQSRAQIQVLLRIKVRRIEDLIIQVALIRPGPIQGGAVHPYIARSLGYEPVTYDHPSLEPALRETKGVFVFQEQVIQAAMAIAGFSSGQAEMLRRAMSRKRSREAMEALRNEFLAGAEARGIETQVAATVYDKILAFASFGFPKSHAAAMAETAFRVAWLKRYYPVEFYCALLNEQPMGFYSPEVICNDARRHGIEVRGVDVNHSHVECSIETEDGSDIMRLGYR
jgi:DNA polymerase III alpha subunit